MYTVNVTPRFSVAPIASSAQSKNAPAAF